MKVINPFFDSIVTVSVADKIRRDDQVGNCLSLWVIGTLDDQALLSILKRRKKTLEFVYGTDEFLRELGESEDEVNQSVGSS